MTLALAYFEALYAAEPDPWNFETRWYEHRKHALSVAALPRQKYESALELGCANGRLTELLAPRCDDLLAVDAVAAPVQRARERLARFDHVRVEQRQLPQQWPEGKFALIVASELLYYFDEDELARVLTLLRASLQPAGTLLAVHWRPVVAEYPLTGDAVHQALRTKVGLGLLAHHEEQDFLLDVLVEYDGPNGPPSVAMGSRIVGAKGSP